MKVQISSSVFKGLNSIEYFDFEEDFVEENMRCIPMIVRFKMDLAGIKLKLSEWSKISVEDRIELATKSCSNNEEASAYHQYLKTIVYEATGNEVSILDIESKPNWANVKNIPLALQHRANEFNWTITHDKWTNLSNLQRYALLKLIRPGHENKLFPKCMKEFKLADNS